MTDHPPAHLVTDRDGDDGAVLPEGTPWRRLDPRMLVVGPLGNLAQLLPVLLLVLFTDRPGGANQIGYAAGGALLVVLAGVVRWQTTRYRITEERVELRTGLFRRQRRSVPRDRIRTVDLTAPLVHRFFSLSVVQVRSATGAGLDGAGRVDLDAVSKAEAERLRRALLDRTAAASGTKAAAEPAVELPRLRGWWGRIAPLPVWAQGGVGGVPAATGAAQAGPTPQPRGTQPCFEDRQAGYGEGERTRFCPR